MTTHSRLQSVSAIGSTDPLQMPVTDVAKAITFYTEKLGFAVGDTRDGPPKSVTLIRGGVTLGLAENGGDPEQASCYIEVDGVSELQEEYKENGVHVSEVGPMEYDGTHHEVFWAKDPDGICYCIGKRHGD